MRKLLANEPSIWSVSALNRSRGTCPASAPYELSPMIPRPIPYYDTDCESMMNTRKMAACFGCIALISMAVLPGHPQVNARMEETPPAEGAPPMADYAQD
jgi:hypothetical protein